MTGWLEVATIAFVTQLLVLPGEKVQFIIAALSTRYHPLLVVSAAATAFAGWTSLEVTFGHRLQTAVPALWLDVFTGLLFCLFAVLLYRSAPAPGESVVETDGGSVSTLDGELDVRVPFTGWRVPNALGGFVPIFAMMAFGEFGDKTQLVTIGLAAQYAQSSAIWVGEMVAIVPVSLANAYVFHRFAAAVDLRKAHFAGAALFALFGADTLQANVTGVHVWDRLVEQVAMLVTSLVPFS